MLTKQVQCKIKNNCSLKKCTVRFAKRFEELFRISALIQENFFLGELVSVHVKAALGAKNVHTTNKTTGGALYSHFLLWCVCVFCA